MIRTIEELRSVSDEELIKEHDKKAKNTSVGTQYYIEELDRRSRDRSLKASNDLPIKTQQLARRTYWQSWISVGAALIALALSVLSFYR